VRRRLAWLGEQVGWALGIVACVLMMLVLMPLIPLFALYDGIRRALEDE
jgi:hypothetical protein